MKRRAFLGQAAALAAVPLILRVPRRAPLHVNGARLNGWLAQFDAIGRTASGINRVAYSDADLAGWAFTLDAQQLALIAPMGMIFVPNVGGISHSPREFTKAEDVVRGVDVLLNSVIAADR